MYEDTDDEPYDPAEDDDATKIAEVHDNKDSPPANPDNNAPVKEEGDPYPGVPGIIGYVPAGVYQDANDANPILLDDAPSTGVHIPQIPGAEDLQIPGLIPDITYNT